MKQVMNPKLPFAASLLAALAVASWAQAPVDANPRSAPAAAPVTHLAVGTVRSVDASGRSVTIDHQAIATLNMPAMTMQFRLPPSSTRSLKPGESIAFTFTASADGLTIGTLQPLASLAGAVRDRAASHDAMPGMDHHDMQGKRGMKSMMGMMDSCHGMMGGR